MHCYSNNLWFISLLVFPEVCISKCFSISQSNRKLLTISIACVRLEPSVPEFREIITLFLKLPNKSSHSARDIKTIAKRLPECRASYEIYITIIIINFKQKPSAGEQIKGHGLDSCQCEEFRFVAEQRRLVSTKPWLVTIMQD